MYPASGLCMLCLGCVCGVWVVYVFVFATGWVWDELAGWGKSVAGRTDSLPCCRRQLSCHMSLVGLDELPKCLFLWLCPECLATDFN